MNARMHIGLPIFLGLVFSLFIPLTANATLSFTDQGMGEALVLIHAFPTDKRLFVPQASLKKHFRLITLDLPGFGESEPTDGQAYTMAAYAEAVSKLLDELHIQKAIIGGESLGGYVALAFLKRYPMRTKGLLLSNTQAIVDADPAMRENAAQEVLTHGSKHLLDTFLPKALSSQATDETRNYLHEVASAQSVNGIASALRGMAKREDTLDVLRKTNVPVLIITVNHDAVISPRQSYLMQARAKNSRLVIIERAGHLSNLEQPKQWNQAVIEMFYNRKH